MGSGRFPWDRVSQKTLIKSGDGIYDLWFRQVGWPEFGVGSRVCSNETKFCIVFHTEGLINDRVIRSLKEFGKEFRDVRPLLTVVPPISPMYQIDPLQNPIRFEFPFRVTPNSVQLDFKSKIQELSSFFDIGYHGHFFVRTNGTCMPTFDPSAISSQFAEEYRFLSDMGFRPLAYAGGWWFMAPHMARLLQSFGFRIDTTLNDIRMDSFNRRQPYAETPLGRPLRLEGNVIEVPTIRSDAAFFSLIRSKRNQQRFAILSLHDYNLVVPPLAYSIGKVARRLVRHDRIVGLSELLSVHASVSVA